MKVFVETERFILREVLETDIEGLYELDSNPEVHRYLGNKPVTNKSEIENIIHFIRKQYLENGIGRWAIIDKQNHDFIGWAGLKLVTDLINHHQNYYDLGYRLIERFWGKGIATEVSSACIQYAFEKLYINELFAIADVKNHASNKILSKIGFTFIETFDLDEIPHNWYRIEKETYKIY